MNAIELACVGELKFPGLRELENKYLQNINFYVKFSIKKLREIHGKEEAFVMEKEGGLFLKEIGSRDYVVALDEKGRSMDSRRFAAFLQERMAGHAGRLLFLIGGFAGLSAPVKARADMALSFSPMTFAHDIFRILFLEQLFRAMTILRGPAYHR